VTGQSGVLVVGAGPTGLARALQAHDHGARVRVVERRLEAFRRSRAMIMHPRTLEVLRPLGVTDRLLARADTSPRVSLHLGTRTVPVDLADLDLPDTAFPHLSLLLQADVEAVLARALEGRGVRIERGTALVGVRNTPDGPEARLRTATRDEVLRSDAVVGCDGADSTVRGALGVGFPGGSYGREVVLADLDLAGDLAPGVAHVAVGRRGLLFLFALGERAPWRLLATRPVGSPKRSPDEQGNSVPDWQLQTLIDDAGLPAGVGEVAWSSRIRLQHRVAERYRAERVFLAGDAAHVSSPAGGTGMNTGIQDATNLGWKLAMAGHSSDAEALLGSYDPERRPVAQHVLALTHLIFWAESSTGAAASVLRGTLAPVLAPAFPWLLRRRRLVAETIRQLSQLQASYHASALSFDASARRSGRPRAGDRLPDAAVTVGRRSVRLHDLLARPGVHVFLDRSADDVTDGQLGTNVHVHRLASSPGTGLVAVRPDGHVGLTTAQADPAALGRWLALLGAGAEGRRGQEPPSIG
jgi:2-polyprenyl-6-methoxyphenol hydroxylase-like FAD-dependent oxidoreductase